MSDDATLNNLQAVASDEIRAGKIESGKMTIFHITVLVYLLLTLLNLALPFLISQTFYDAGKQVMVENYVKTFSIPIQGLGSMVSFMFGYYFKESQQ
jgi:hypothetical protein